MKGLQKLNRNRKKEEYEEGEEESKGVIRRYIPEATQAEKNVRAVREEGLSGANTQVGT